MKTTTNETVDLVALYAEVTAELEAERIASEKVCDEMVAEYKTTRAAHTASVRAANKRGQY